MEISAATGGFETAAPQFNQPAQPSKGGARTRNFSDVMAEASDDADSSPDAEVDEAEPAEDEAVFVPAPAPVTPQPPIEPIELEWTLAACEAQSHVQRAYGLYLGSEAGAGPAGESALESNPGFAGELSKLLVAENAPPPDPSAPPISPVEVSPVEVLPALKGPDSQDFHASLVAQPALETADAGGAIPKLEQASVLATAFEEEAALATQTQSVQDAQDPQQKQQLAFEVRMSAPKPDPRPHPDEVDAIGEAAEWTQEAGDTQPAFPSWPETQTKATATNRSDAAIPSPAFTGVEDTRWQKPETTAAEPLRRLYVNVGGDNGPVRLQISERAGELRASVFGNNAEVVERIQAGLGDLSRSLTERGVEAEVVSRAKESHLGPHVVSPASSAPDVQVSVANNEKSFDDGSAKHGHGDEQQRHGSDDSKRDDDEPDFNSHMKSYQWLAR